MANAWAVAVAENSRGRKKGVGGDHRSEWALRIARTATGKIQIYSWQDLEEGSWEDPDVLKEYEEKGRAR